jgi:hypothetical protein
VSAGVATFATLSINDVGTYTLVASSTPAYTAATSSTFTVTPGPPTQLAFIQEPPATLVAGASMAPAVTVAAEDAYGNIETADNATQVTLTFGTNAGGGTLTGGGPVTVASGIATFSGVWVNKTGTGYTLTATSAPPLIPATSSAFNVTPGPPTQLGFVQQPTLQFASTALSPAVTVAVEDAYGNVETGDNATQVSLAIGTNPGGGTLSGGAATTVVAGIATFPNLSINYIGVGYTLVASSTPTYTSATSLAFTIKEGTLTLSCAAPPAPQAATCPTISLPAVSLDGNWQMVQSSANELYLSDTRGLANVGWSVSAYMVPTPTNPNPACATVADFCNTTLGASGPDAVIPAWSLLVTGITCTAASGNPVPNPQAGPGANFPEGSAAVDLCTAAVGQSTGSFQIGAQYYMGVPPYVHAGQYQATVEQLAF